MGIERRKYARATIGLTLKVRHQNIAEFAKGYAINVSAGGLCIRSRQPLPVGSVVQFEIQLADSSPALQGRGEVVWSLPPAGPGEAPRIPGMGVRFLELDERSRALVEQIVSQSQPGPEDGPVCQEIPPAPATTAAPAEPLFPPDDPAAAPTPTTGSHPLTDLAAGAKETPAASGRAAKLQGPALKKWVIDALITALEIAETPGYEDSSALRNLFESVFSKLFDNGTVDLNVPWNILVGNEEMTVELAALPLLVFSLGRSVHGLSVRLPEALQQLHGHRKTRDIARRRIDAKGGFDRVMAQVAGRNMAEAEAEAGKPRKAEAGTMAARRRPSVVQLVFGVAVLAVGIAGILVSAYLLMPRSATLVDLTEAGSILKLADGKQKDQHLTAVIVDERWPQMQKGDREEALRKLAALLLPRGISDISLFSTKSQLVGFIVANGDGSSPPEIQLINSALQEESPAP